jgi:putative ABC transport system permease protein
MIIYQKLNFVHKQRLGFDKAHKLVMDTRGRLGDQDSAFKRELQRQAAVQQVTMSSSLIGAPNAISFVDGASLEGYQGDPEDSFILSHYWIDYDFIETLGLEITQGRAFSEAYASDVDGFIVNETAARAFGWEAPVGKRITWDDVDRPVVGVVSDFHAQSMHKEIEPLLFEIGNSTTFVTLSMAPSNFTRSQVEIQSIWDRFLPELPFKYSFLEDDIEAMYRAEHRMGQLFFYFAALAIVVACLGLFGLAAFTAMQRTKEIGIRKTLGASTPSLVQLLSRDYLKLLGIAFLVASPIAYFAMNHWLEGFAYHIALSVWIFLGAGMLAVVIALLTASVHSIKAAQTNPVEALRYE